MKSVANKNILLIGAGGGIGSALTRQLISKKARVIAVDRDIALLQERVNQQLDARENQVTFVESTLHDLASCDAVIAHAVAQFGRIDGLICATGALSVHRGQVDSTSYRARLDSNLFVPLQLAESLLKHRQKESWRSDLKIVVLSSLVSQLNPLEVFDYALAKAALESAFYLLRQSNRGEGVQVLIARPGFVDSDLSQPFRYRPFSISADDAATRIIQATEGTATTVSFPTSARWLSRLARFTPRLASRAFAFCLERDRNSERSQ